MHFTLSVGLKHVFVSESFIVLTKKLKKIQLFQLYDLYAVKFLYWTVSINLSQTYFNKIDLPNLGVKLI